MTISTRFGNEIILKRKEYLKSVALVKNELESHTVKGQKSDSQKCRFLVVHWGKVLLEKFISVYRLQFWG